MADFISVEQLNEQFTLKPRFKIEFTDLNIYDRLSAYQQNKNLDSVKIKCLDEHIWLSIPQSDRRYYSPRLHVEIEQKKKGGILHCTFGPDPGLWTMFMFVHFFLGLGFIGLLVWFYTNLTLDYSNFLVYILMSFVALLWIGLYVFARQNRQKAAPQSQQLLKALAKIIS
ncbi:hypothetical protein [Psychroflexus aestuariivivens]|uniref:hypothetical protein n=1 Tax=Psychroflexus aestuariivivens TaxID=1795040 RepID=UPI000FD7F0F7|nr:hypothetical protein [Psychroflexus aestuariivivens]